MRIVQEALRVGLRRVFRYWRPIVLLYGINLGLGLIEMWPLLRGNALYNPFLNDLVTGGSSALVNLFLGASSAWLTVAAWLALAIPLLLIYGLAYNFVAGGALSTYGSIRPFWAGSRRMFWSFTGLGLLVIVLIVCMLIVSGIVGWLVGLRVGMLVGVVLIQIVNLLGEYARAVAVARDRHNPFVVFGWACVFCVRNMGGVLLLAVLGLILTGGLAALYAGVTVLLPGSPAIVLAQQLLTLGWLAIKLLRLSWAITYVQRSDLQPQPTAFSLSAGQIV